MLVTCTTHVEFSRSDDSNIWRRVKVNGVFIRIRYEKGGLFFPNMHFTVSTNVVYFNFWAILIISVRFLDSRGREYEVGYLLGCCAVEYGKRDNRIRCSNPVDIHKK